jgi:hypothetical protein
LGAGLCRLSLSGAIRILDFVHAAEHINPIGEFLHGEHTPESQAWLKEHLHCLKQEGPDQLLMREFENYNENISRQKLSRAIWLT